MVNNRHQKAANHDAAPIAGRFVEDFRNIFGESVKVTYVKEGATEMGKRDTRPAFEARPYKTLWQIIVGAFRRVKP